MAMHPLRVVSLLALVAMSACETPPSPPLFVCPFDDDAPGAWPASWRAAETNGRGTPGAWRITDSDGRRHVRLARTSNKGQTFNLLLAPGEYPADVAIATQVRADAGEEDQGGGVIWRARNAANYYIARWNPLEDNLRVYKVVDSKRTQLGSVATTARSGWHQLGVQARGRRIQVWFDGAFVLAVDDTTFPAGGRVGLWTKADAATSFDDFSVTPATAAGRTPTPLAPPGNTSTVRK